MDAHIGGICILHLHQYTPHFVLSAYAFLVGWGWGLRLVEVVGVVFEDDVSHGLLPLFEDHRIVVGDLTFWERFAVDAGGHEPFAVVIAQVDILYLSSILESHKPCWNDLVSGCKGDGLSVRVDG